MSFASIERINSFPKEGDMSMGAMVHTISRYGTEATSLTKAEGFPYIRTSPSAASLSFGQESPGYLQR